LDDSATLELIAWPVFVEKNASLAELKPISAWRQPFLSRRNYVRLSFISRDFRYQHINSKMPYESAHLSWRAKS